MATLTQPAGRRPSPEGQPRLFPGDHLDRATFHARYEAMPPGTRAELVGGIVYMPSPLHPAHGKAHSEVIGWLIGYKTATPGVEVLDNTTIFLAEDGEPQPDACLILSPDRGGQTREEEYVVGAPELVVEVAHSSEAYDLHSKKRDYERAGVREYVVVVLRQQKVLWFVRRGAQFEELPPGDDGLLRSEVFPGLWLDPAALLRRDSGAVRRALEQGLASPGHAAFTGR